MILDVLGDVGGLSSVIVSVFATILTIVKYNNLNAQVVSKLFKFKGAGTTGSEANLY